MDSHSSNSECSGGSKHITYPSSLIDSRDEKATDSDDSETVNEPQLPAPFYPPSILRSNDGVEIKPRPLPDKLGLPRVPGELACIIIDPQDKYAELFLIVFFSFCVLLTLLC